MADIAASNAISTSTIYGSTILSRNTIAWDYDVMMGCICNSSWKVGFGAGEYQLSEYYLPDCSYSKLSRRIILHISLVSYEIIYIYNRTMSFW